MCTYYPIRCAMSRRRASRCVFSIIHLQILPPKCIPKQGNARVSYEFIIFYFGFLILVENLTLKCIPNCSKIVNLGSILVTFCDLWAFFAAQGQGSEPRLELLGCGV